MSAATLIGNGCLALAAVVSLYLASALYRGGRPVGGDAAVSALWEIITLNLVFLALMVGAALAIGWNGGFEWVASSGTGRFLLVTSGLLSAAVVATVSGLVKGESGPLPPPVRFFAAFLPVIVPLALVSAGFVLVNDGLREAVPPGVYQWPLWGIFAVGVAGLGWLLYAWVAHSARNATRLRQDIRDREAENLRQHLDQIERCDVTKEMVFILALTDANHEPVVRERALAKIRSHPASRQELIRLLGSGWASEAFTFLASNDVDDKRDFAEPVRQGVLGLARIIRERIRETSHEADLYPERFAWEVSRALRTVDRFRDPGIDFRSAVQDLRDALDEPSPHRAAPFQCVKALDQWLGRN